MHGPGKFLAPKNIRVSSYQLLMASESDEDVMQVSPPRVARTTVIGNKDALVCCVCFETGESGHVHSFAQARFQ
jgi:hypothetical protein